MNMLPWLTWKKNILQTSLLTDWTDVHTHLLPGVDDGIQNLIDAKAALEFLRKKGVRRAFLTPHMMNEYPENTRDALLERFRILNDICPFGLDLRLAAEYMLDAGFESRMKEGMLTMDGRHVLVETSYLSSPPGLLNMLYELALEKYIPVLAHPERYLYLMKQEYSYLKEKGYKFQLNLFSLVGAYGSRSRRNAEYLLSQGLYDFVGSDFHRIKNYTENLERLYLTRRQVDGIKLLMANNNLLWEAIQDT